MVFVRARLQPCRKTQRRRAALAAEGMSRPKRHGSIPGTYFLTSRTWESRPVFKIAPPCEIFIEAMLRYRDEGRYQLHAFVLMPDHLHILLTPSGSITIERAAQFVKGGSSFSIGEKLAMKVPVWQPGFSDHRIRDAADYDVHLKYLEENPVKRGLAVQPSDYKWSSASGAYRMDPRPQGLKPMSIAAKRRS